ncbi:MAG: hypothetical protein JXA90_09800 [Planctomycetes bacterium]|nr:hypothetical protein [Planctomycetota bacterium]
MAPASERLRVHKIASVVYRLGLSKEVEMTSDLVVRSGNAIVVRALNEKRVYSELELENGRMSKIFRGDLLIGALGRRRALRGFAGDVPAKVQVGDVLALLNRGGVIGGSATDHKDLGLPVACEVLGMPVRDGRVINIADGRLPRVEDFRGDAYPPVLIVSGTSMECGKTLFLSALIQELSKSGLVIAGGKLTGIACLRDLISMEDHGAAAAASFLDVGYPSTAGLDDASLLEISRTVIGHLAASRPDMIALELGDGIIGDYGVLSVLKDAEVSRAVRMHAFCAGDLVGAWGGQHLLREQGISIDIVSGPVTDNAVGVHYLEETLGVRAINAYRNPEKIAELVVRHLGLGGQRRE